jgi:hypothetical protein
LKVLQAHVNEAVVAVTAQQAYVNELVERLDEMHRK